MVLRNGVWASLRKQFKANTFFVRNYATHKETGGWRPGGSSGRGWYQTSFWEKYRVPLLFTAGVMAVDYFVVPRVINNIHALRRNPELMVYGIIGVNVAGFLAWRIRGAPAATMLRYGLLQKIPNRFSVWQMLGSAFSHQDGWHLAINMFVLWQFGVPVANWLGSGQFARAYIDSCVLSSLGSMLLPLLVRRWTIPSGLPSLGASGAVFAMLGTFSYLAPHAKLALWFIPLPVGAWTVFLLTLGYNAVAMSGKLAIGRGFDHAGHVAGSLVGIGYGWWVTKRREQRYRARPRPPRLF